MNKKEAVYTYEKGIQKELCKAVKEMLQEGESAEINHIRRNNGVFCHGIVIKREGKKEAPIIYIDNLLWDLKSGKITLSQAARTVLDIYKRAEVPKEVEQVRCFTREDILERTEYKLINFEKNEEILEELPHRRLLDLAVVYQMVLNWENGVASILINRQMMEQYFICEEELKEAAERNRRRKGVCVKSMAAVIDELTGMPSKEPELSIPMWVISTPDGNYGAVALLDESCFESPAEEIGGDLYILPSSTHEVLAVPEEGVSPEELRQIVREVNTTEVSEQDFLSGNVYRYNKREHRLESA